MLVQKGAGSFGETVRSREQYRCELKHRLGNDHKPNKIDDFHLSQTPINARKNDSPLNGEERTVPSVP